MIAVSDAVLVLVSATALVSGLYRWQTNLEHARLAATRPPVSVQEQVLTQTPAQTPTRTPSGTLVQTPEPSFTQAPGQSAGVAPAPLAEPLSATDSSPSAREDTTGNAADTSTEPAFGRYIVQPGDILGRLALRFDTTVSELQRINGLEDTLINVGQELRYPLQDN